MKKRRSLTPYLLIAPSAVIVVCVVLIPVIRAIVMSFQSYDLRRPKEIGFVGLSNYIGALNDPLFRNALLRTVIWVAAGVGFQFLIGLLLALILNGRFRGRGVVRAVSMIPWVTPGVLIGLMWRWIYDGNFGVLNDILKKLHLIHTDIPFLSQVNTAFPAVIVAIVWQGIPFFALMLLAALQSVDKDMYEAADMDGANRIQRFFYITLPSIKNTIFITVLLRVIWVANSVDVIFNMTEGGPAYSTQTLSVYIYNKANALDLGYASAMAVMLAVLLLAVVIPYLRLNFGKEEA